MIFRILDFQRIFTESFVFSSTVVKLIKLPRRTEMNRKLYTHLYYIRGNRRDFFTQRQLLSLWRYVVNKLNVLIDRARIHLIELMSVADVKPRQSQIRGDGCHPEEPNQVVSWFWQIPFQRMRGRKRSAPTIAAQWTVALLSIPRHRVSQSQSCKPAKRYNCSDRKIKTVTRIFVVSLALRRADKELTVASAKNQSAVHTVWKMKGGSQRTGVREE